MKKFVRTQTKARLRKLNQRLKRASRDSTDADAIHDLRVAIRRHLQCLRVFEQFFGRKKAAKTRKRLRKVLDRCGAVRNYDVALELMSKIQRTEDRVIPDLQRSRRAAEKDLVRALARWRGRRLEAPPEKIADEGPWNIKASPARNAAGRLPLLAEEWYQAGETAAAPKSTFAAMHRFRLRTKRFRYTLELFKPVYAGRTELETGMAKLRGLQDALGAMNDCVMSKELLKKHRGARAAVTKLLDHREKEFRVLWSKEFKPSTLDWWKQWLGTAKEKTNRNGSVHPEARRSRAARPGNRRGRSGAGSEGEKSRASRAGKSA